MKKSLILICITLFLSKSFAQWYPLNSSTNNFLLSLHFVDDNTGYTVGQLGIMLKTTNAGNNWITVETGTGSGTRVVYFIDHLTGIALKETNYIIRTTNSGVNWNTIYSSIQFSPNDVCFINKDTGFAVGTQSGVIKTTDSGLTWDTVIYNYGSYSVYQSVFFINGTTGFIGGYEPNLFPKLLRTTNSGQNWIEMQSAPSFGIFDIFFVNSSTGFASGHFSNIHTGYSGISKTTNAGLNWGTVLTSNNSVERKIYFSSLDTGYCIGKSYVDNTAHIYKTVNGGVNWYLQFLQTANNDFHDLFFTNKQTGYIVGTNGIILKTTNGGTFLSINQISNETSRDFSLLQNYPNPFNPFTKINFSIASKSDVNIAVYNTIGMKVYETAEKNLEPGKYEMHFDGSNLSSGIYFCRFEAVDNYTTVKYIESNKMMLIK